MSKPTKKRPRGRPVIKNPLKKRYFRATDAQWKMFKAANGGNMGRWIREVCIQAVERKLK